MSATEESSPASIDGEEPKALSRIGRASAVLLLPFYLFATFYFRRWVEPRALATYSFLVGAPAAVALVLSRGPSKSALQSFFATSLVILASSAAIYWADIEAEICFIVILLPFFAVGSVVSLVSNIRHFRRLKAATSKAGTTALLLLVAPVGALVEKSAAEVESVHSTSSWIQVS